MLPPPLGLVDRLMALLEGVGLPLHVLYLVELKACPSPELLEAALRAVVRSDPTLCSRLVDGPWAPQRLPWSPEEAGWPALLELAEPGDPAALARFRAEPLPLAEGPPLRAMLRPEVEGPCLLALKLHHAASDATGGLALLHRWAQALGQVAAGEAALALVPAPSPKLALPWAAAPGVAWRSLQETFAGLGRPARVWASLVHQLPASGRARHLALRLKPHQVEELRVLAKGEGASLNEWLMAIVLHRLAQALPQGELQRPFSLHLAVSLRSPGDLSLANRVGDLRLVMDPQLLKAGPRSALGEVLRTSGPLRADRRLALGRLLERWLPSRFPPRSFRRLLRAYMARPTNQVMTLDWSNLGDAGPLPGPWGEVEATAAYFLPPLSTPPGVAVAIATLGGKLTLAMSYAEGVLPRAQVEGWMAQIGQDLQAARQARTGPLPASRG